MSHQTAQNAVQKSSETRERRLRSKTEFPRPHFGRTLVPRLLNIAVVFFPIYSLRAGVLVACLACRGSQFGGSRRAAKTREKQAALGTLDKIHGE